MLKLLDEEPEENDGSSSHRRKTTPFWKRFSAPEKQPSTSPNDPEDISLDHDDHNRVRTLQRAFGGPNAERIAYMEAHSSLTPLHKIVHVEQVSIFMIPDGTVVSFFEISGDDIEPPILSRLFAQSTLLRTSSDPSMMLQAIIDGIVDLCFPVVSAYQDTIAELELNVLTDPVVEQSRDLYILTSELAMLKSTISPIAGVITSLRDHRRTPPMIRNGTGGVEVSDMTRIYLRDVLDHVTLILQVSPPGNGCY